VPSWARLPTYQKLKFNSKNRKEEKKVEKVEVDLEDSKYNLS